VIPAANSAFAGTKVAINAHATSVFFIQSPPCFKRSANHIDILYINYVI
jgi:hypothetical protein